MAVGPIYVFGSKSDAHVQKVVEYLENDGRELSVFDIFDPSQYFISEPINDQVKLLVGSGHSNIGRPSAVWRRIKPSFYLRTENIESYYNQQFSLREWTPTLEYFDSTLDDVYTINNRWREARASNKLFQLKMATSFELEIPRTIVSNNPDEICSFIENLPNSQCIHKTFMPYISPALKQKFATIIGRNTIQDYKDDVESCPAIYQEVLRASHELRITIVGGIFFSAKITKIHSDVPDWRTEIQSANYDTIEIDTKLRRALSRFHKHLGLIFAAYDILVTESGRHIFLEVNPGGQWLWLEERLELPISKAIADHLVRDV